MINLPDFDKSFEYENGFWLSSDTSRLRKTLAHFELYKLILNTKGAFAEFGVFKAVSFVRFLTFRALLENNQNRNFYGFDTFSTFPEGSKHDEEKMLNNFIKDAGSDSISVDQLKKVLKHKKIDKNVKLIEGNILDTLPDFVENYPDEKFAMIHIDVDIYEPTKCILENLYKKLVVGGVLILDDYNVWKGETKAVDDFISGSELIREFDFCNVPKYIIKGH